MHQRLLPIVRPCDEEWGAMRANGGEGRHCARCSTTVVDLSAMTEREARAHISRAGGELCVRYRRDADGEVRFRPEPPRRGASAWAIGLGLGLASVLGGARPVFADTSIPPAGSSPGDPQPQPPAAPPSQQPAPLPGRPIADRDKNAEHPKKPPAPPKLPPENYVMGKMVAPKF